MCDEKMKEQSKDMITKATPQDIVIVQEIVYKTINSIYPDYYLPEVVDFFVSHHSEENILIDLNKGNVFLLSIDGVYVGTGTKSDDHISRLFILPRFQGKGFGSKLMDFLEEQISLISEIVFLDSSLPAYSLYTKRGYYPIEYIKEKVENGKILCYHLMKKELKKYSVL
jgi:GNAT superfamily N-acetyltransferase